MAGEDYVYLAIAAIIVYVVFAQAMPAIVAGILAVALFTGGVAVSVTESSLHG